MLMDFIKGFIVGLGASIPLGPIGILCIQRTLSKGRWSGFSTGMGAAFSDTLFSAIALLGLSFFDNLMVEYRDWVMLIGGIIVAGFGLKIFMTNPVKQLRRVKEGNHQYFQDFGSAFIMTITNPGAILLIIGLFAFAGIDLNRNESGFIIASTLWGVFSGAVLWWFSLSTTINLFRNKFRLRQLLITNRIAGVVIMVLGMISVFEGLVRFIGK